MHAKETEPASRGEEGRGAEGVDGAMKNKKSRRSARVWISVSERELDSFCLRAPANPKVEPSHRRAFEPDVGPLKYPAIEAETMSSAATLLETLSSPTFAIDAPAYDPRTRKPPSLIAAPAPSPPPSPPPLSPTSPSLHPSQSATSPRASTRPPLSNPYTTSTAFRSRRVYPPLSHQRGSTRGLGQEGGRWEGLRGAR